MMDYKCYHSSVDALCLLKQKTKSKSLQPRFIFLIKATKTKLHASVMMHRAVILVMWVAFLLACINWIVLLKLYHNFPMITLLCCFFSHSHSSSVWNPVLLCGGQAGSISQLDPGSDWGRRRVFLCLPLLRVLGLCWLQVHCHAVSRPAFHVWGNYS